MSVSVPPLGQQKFMPRGVSSQCLICSQPFNRSRSKKRCKRCGFLVCEGCSPSRASVQGSAETIRVCVYCYSELNDNSKSHEEFLSQMEVVDKCAVPEQHPSTFSLMTADNGRCKFSGMFKESEQEEFSPLQLVGYLKRNSSGCYYFRFFVPNKSWNFHIFLSDIDPGITSIDSSLEISGELYSYSSNVYISLVNAMCFLEDLSLQFESVIISGSASFRFVFPYIFLTDRIPQGEHLD